MTRGVDSGLSKRSVPVRTCVGCRERAPKTQLLRLVADQDDQAGQRLVSVRPDPTGRRPGRGASVHPTARCLDLAERHRAFARAFRLAGPFDLAEVRGYVQQLSDHEAGTTPSDEGGNTR